MKYSLLCIGTELTSGQILNRNSQFLAKKMQKYGIEAFAQLTVADDHTDILRSLEFLQKNSELILVTGGLGPTTDDFTRNVLANWAQLPLQFDPISWQHLNQQLNKRNLQVLEMHKQECYFPQSSQIFLNSEGTASAFVFQKQNTLLCALPGPPKEIEAVWNDHLQTFFAEKFKLHDQLITKSWDCIGLAESELAEKTETLLKNCQLLKGYRAHLPYVEFKISFKKSEEQNAKPWLEKIDQLLKPWTVLKNGEDIINQIALKFQQQKILQFKILDTVTNGKFFSRILNSEKNYLHTVAFDYCTNADMENHIMFDLVITSKDELSISMHCKNKERILACLERIKNFPERKILYFTELVLLEMGKLD